MSGTVTSVPIGGKPAVDGFATPDAIRCGADDYRSDFPRRGAPNEPYATRLAIVVASRATALSGVRTRTDFSRLVHHARDVRRLRTPIQPRSGLFSRLDLFQLRHHGGARARDVLYDVLSRLALRRSAARGAEPVWGAIPNLVLSILPRAVDGVRRALGPVAEFGRSTAPSRRWRESQTLGERNSPIAGASSC